MSGHQGVNPIESSRRVGFHHHPDPGGRLRSLKAHVPLPLSSRSSPAAVRSWWASSSRACDSSKGCRILTTAVQLQQRKSAPSWGTLFVRAVGGLSADRRRLGNPEWLPRERLLRVDLVAEVLA
jgi:hypothetical protein